MRVRGDLGALFGRHIGYLFGGGEQRWNWKRCGVSMPRDCGREVPRSSSSSPPPPTEGRSSSLLSTLNRRLNYSHNNIHIKHGEFLFTLTANDDKLRFNTGATIKSSHHPRSTHSRRRRNRLCSHRFGTFNCSGFDGGSFGTSLLRSLIIPWSCAPR